MKSHVFPTQKVKSWGRVSMRMLGLPTAILCLAGLGLAQSTNSGDIRGTVTDPTGARVPNAKVTVLNVDTGVSRDYYTNVDGLYDTVSILAGTYRITFSKEGFTTLVRDGITLQVGAPITVDGHLALGASQQKVDVTGEAPLLETESAEQSTDFEKQTLTELPNVTRDWRNFTKMLPGVTGTGGDLTVNGAMPYYASFQADGASTTLPESANVDTTNFEAISEVEIVTSTFSAQYGSGAAVYNQISKSGTNQLHGSLYEYFQNNVLNARSFFSPKVPISRFNDFGGSVAGPVRNDKLFFYFNFEKELTDGYSYSYYTYPTSDMLAGNFSNPIFPTIYDPNTLVNGSRTPFPGNVIPANRMDPLALAVQKYFPTPNLPGYANNLLFPVPFPNNYLKYFGRADYDITDRNRLTATIAPTTQSIFSYDPTCPISCFPYTQLALSSQLSDVWNATPTLVNEVRLGYVRERLGSINEDVGANYPEKLGWTYAEANAFPQVSINGPVGATSLGGGYNDRTTQNGEDFSDTVTWIRGKHILHFGAELLAYQDNVTAAQYIQAGNFFFSGVFTTKAPFTAGGLGYADFLLGQVDNWNATNSPINGMREYQPQFFVQDDFKVLPNFTVNLGLRYQIQGGWHEIHNQLGEFDPTILNPATNTLGAMWYAPNNGRNSVQAQVNDIFLPRVGFSWNPKANWVVRGGMGIYSYNWSGNTYFDNAEGVGASSTGSLAESTQTEPIFLFSSSNPPLNYEPASKSPASYNGHSVGYYPYHTPVVRNYQWSISIQRQLPGGMVAEGAYTGNHTNNLSWPVDINQVPYSLLGVGNPQNERPYPQFLTISGDRYVAISNYDSMQLSLRKRFSAGLSFDVNYTLSKMLDEQDSAGWSGNAGSQLYQNAYLPGVNYGYSNLNRAQMFKGDVVYQLPIGKGLKLLKGGGPLDWFFGGWQASTIFLAESGSPFTPTMGTANLSGALSGSWYPNIVGSTGISNPTTHDWFNLAAFAQPAPFTFGNAGRNILFGPMMSDIDFALAKNFGVPKLERGKIQFRIDATNVINHPSFSNPNASIGSPNAGIITGTSVAGRAIQLGARLTF